MKHFFPAIFILSIILLNPTSVAATSFVTIQPNGDAYFNVLGWEDERKPATLEVTQIAGRILPTPNAQISVTRHDGKISLDFAADGKNMVTDVTEYKDNLIEIEHREAEKKIEILANENDFLIKQDNVSARTIFGITVNTKERNVEVETPTGKRILGIYPGEALKSVKNANIVDELKSSMELTETAEGELKYQFTADKDINILNLTQINTPLEVSVSAITGEVIEVNKPWWLRVFGFLLE